MSGVSPENSGSPRSQSPVLNSIEEKMPPTQNKAAHAADPPVAAASAHLRERDIWGTGTPARPSFAGQESASASASAAGASQKRKRSTSPDVSAPRLADLERMSAAETAAAAMAAASASAGTLRPDHPQMSVETRDPYEQHQREQREREQQQREQNRADLWYSRPDEERRGSGSYDAGQSSSSAYHQRADSIPSPIDDNAGNDSERRSKSAARGSASPQSDDDEDQSGAYSAKGYSPSQPRKAHDGMPQSDPKKRKRNFSNRTKTGCLTCRKRKKKCDETKPECSNCVRGGFICAGYPPHKLHWSRPEPAKTVVQIESKDPNYVPPGAYGMPSAQPSPVASQPSQPPVPIAPLQPPQRRESMPSVRGPALRIEPPKGRPIRTDDDRPTATTLPSALLSTTLSFKHSALSALSAPAFYPTPISAATPTLFDRTPKDYQRVPPLSDMARQPEPDTPQRTTLPQINIHRAGTPPRMEQSPPQMNLAPPTLPAPPHPHVQHHPVVRPPAVVCAPSAHQLPKLSQLPQLSQLSQLPQLPSLPQLTPRPPAEQAPPVREAFVPHEHQHEHAHEHEHAHAHEHAHDHAHEHAHDHAHAHAAREPPHEPVRDFAHAPHQERPREYAYDHLHGRVLEYPPSHEVRHMAPPQYRPLPPPAPSAHQPHGSHDAADRDNDKAEQSPGENQVQASRPYTPPPVERSPSPRPNGQQPPTTQLARRRNSDDEEDMDADAERGAQVPFFNTVRGPRRERDEMDGGRPFYQFDMELIDARERCSAACWKFNSAMNPALNLSPPERSRLFRDILHPRDELNMPPVTRTGSVGERVTVEAPFHADYGFNVQIGSEVYIGRNCHMTDAMPITIGDRVYIGPNVSMYTTRLASDASPCDGVHSALYGRGIDIGDDVYIEGSVTILAGVSIAPGSVIRAGSVVTAE